MPKHKIRETKQKGLALSSVEGFTIIELIVVVAIISVLAGIVTVSVNQYQQKAKSAWALGQINQIQKALELYKAQYGRYPYQAEVNGNGDYEDASHPTGIDAGGCADFVKKFTEYLTPKLAGDNKFIAQVKDYSNNDAQPCSTLSPTFATLYNPFFEYETDLYNPSDPKATRRSPYVIFIGSPYPIPGLKSAIIIARTGEPAPNHRYYYYVLPSQ